MRFGMCQKYFVLPPQNPSLCQKLEEMWKIDWRLTDLEMKSRTKCFNFCRLLVSALRASQLSNVSWKRDHGCPIDWSSRYTKTRFNSNWWRGMRALWVLACFMLTNKIAWLIKLNCALNPWFRTGTEAVNNHNFIKYVISSVFGYIIRRLFLWGNQYRFDMSA